MGKWTCKQNKCDVFCRKLSLKTPPTSPEYHLSFLYFLDSYPRLVFTQTSMQTYMCFHRMHETTSTAMEMKIPNVADKMMATSMATAVSWGYCNQCPHTGRQSEVFPIALQEKPSRHWSVLQLFSERLQIQKTIMMTQMCSVVATSHPTTRMAGQQHNVLNYNTNSFQSVNSAQLLTMHNTSQLNWYTMYSLVAHTKAEGSGYIAQVSADIFPLWLKSNNSNVCIGINIPGAT